MKAITLEDYFGRVSYLAEPSQEVVGNAQALLSKVNAMLAEIGMEEASSPTVNSGWRPANYNARVPGAAVNSKHITGQAIDLADPDGALDEYLFSHPEVLEAAGLWMEHPLATKGWVHLQSVPPRSGRRIFYP